MLELALIVAVAFIVAGFSLVTYAVREIRATRPRRK